MRIVENFTELNKIKLNQLFKYINNHILQAIHSKKYFYCFDSKKNIRCNLYTVGSRGCISSVVELWQGVPEVIGSNPICIP